MHLTNIAVIFLFSISQTRCQEQFWKESTKQSLSLMTRHRESISVASLPPIEQAMKNTWVDSGSISAENVWWKKVVSSSLISKSHRRTCTFELFQSRSLLLNYLNFFYFDVSLWIVIVNNLEFEMSFVLFILSDVNIDKNSFLVSLWHMQSFL